MKPLRPTRSLAAFVAAEGFYAWLDTLEENADAKLVEERAAAG